MASDDFAHLRQLEEDLTHAKKAFHILTGTLDHARITQLETDIKKEKTKLVLLGHFVEDFDIND